MNKKVCVNYEKEFERLKEAKKTINNFLESLKEDTPIRNVIPDWATVQKEEITALKTVLQALDNSIPKDKVKEKIEELEILVKEFEETDNTQIFIKTNSIDYYKLEALKELLEDK